MQASLSLVRPCQCRILFNTKNALIWFFIAALGWLVFLSVHLVMVIDLSQVPEITVFSTWKATLIIHLGCSTKVDSGGQWRIILSLTSKFHLEEVSDAFLLSWLFSLITHRIKMHLNKIEIIYLKSIGVFVKAFEILDLVNLCQIHLIFNHCILRLQNILLAFVIIY